MQIFHLSAAILCGSMLPFLHLRYGAIGLIISLLGMVLNIYFYHREKK